MIDLRAFSVAVTGGRSVRWPSLRLAHQAEDCGRTTGRWAWLVAALAICFCGQAIAGRMNASAMRVGGHYDQFIVKFDRNSIEAGDANARQQHLDPVGRANGVRLRQLRHLAIGADVIKSNVHLGHAAALRVMQQLAHDPRVEYVELDAIRTATLTPNDPGYSSQWHYFEPTAGINLPAAWGKATGSGTVVAVIDTGITPHADLTKNIVAGYDFISDTTISGDGDGRDANPNDEGDWVVADQCSVGDSASDSSWHGTHVAGTIAALTNNGSGVAGVAFNARVMPLRVLGHCGGYSSDVADAIVWASGGAVTGAPTNTNPAEVINLSLGGAGACDNTTQAAINRAFNAGTVVVVSAGNSNDSAANQSPANCANVVTVGAVGRTGARASYSNFGSLVDVSAPGGDGDDGVLSTINLGTTTQGAQGYAYYEGTSMAAPHVAGAIALMQSLHAHTPAAVESILKSTARTLPRPCSEGCGAGIIDAALALSAAAQPILTIRDVSIVEGDSGTKSATFTVWLSQPVSTPVTFNIATASGTAVSGTDFTALNLTGQTIAAGATSKTFNVSITGDTIGEADETFHVNVSNVVGVVVGHGQAIGTIINNDPLTLRNNVPVTINASAGEQRLYVLTLPTSTASLYLNLNGGTGTIYVGFGRVPTTTSFDASNSGSPPSLGWGTPPYFGKYYILVDATTSMTNITLTASYHVYLSVSNASVIEGNAGTTPVTFTVSLPEPVSYDSTYRIYIGDGTATSSNGDFVPSDTTQTIPAGSLSKATTFQINGDTAVEPNESFVVHVVSMDVGGAPTGTGTIVNDDGPTLSIDNTSLTEGSSGTKLANFIVRLSQVSGNDVQVDVATADATALAGKDYVATSTTAHIPAGTRAVYFSVPIFGDAVVESNEVFAVNLSNAVGVSVADPQATGVIVNDDSAGDIFWRNQVTGANSIWKAANSTTYQSLATVSNLAWKVVGIADFNADAKADVLWRNSTTGANTIWKSYSSTSLQAVTSIADPAWHAVAVGDFDGEGHADILWRNASTGANVIWKSGNSATPQPVTGITSQAWQVVGAADFDRDGKADILWHDGSTGANVIWRAGNSATQQSVTGVTDPAWRIAGVADFNGDSKADILWHNDATGAGVIWNSANATTKQAVATLADVHWKVAAVADYSADGKADILWRNDLSGANMIWQSGLASTPQTVTPVTDVHWMAVP